MLMDLYRYKFEVDQEAKHLEHEMKTRADRLSRNKRWINRLIDQSEYGVPGAIAEIEIAGDPTILDPDEVSKVIDYQISRVVDQSFRRMAIGYIGDRFVHTEYWLDRQWS